MQNVGYGSFLEVYNFIFDVYGKVGQMEKVLDVFV